MSICFEGKQINSKEISDIIGHKKIMFMTNTLGHDGYDKYGPQSDLYDVYIFTREDDDYVYYHFHTENWFEYKVFPDYELCKKVKLTENKNQDCKMFMELYKDFKNVIEQKEK